MCSFPCSMWRHNYCGLMWYRSHTQLEKYEPTDCILLQYSICIRNHQSQITQPPQAAKSQEERRAWVYKISFPVVWSGSALFDIWFIGLFLTKMWTEQILIRWHRCAQIWIYTGCTHVKMRIYGVKGYTRRNDDDINFSLTTQSVGQLINGLYWQVVLF
jgi:hypothetical protein